MEVRDLIVLHSDDEGGAPDGYMPEESRIFSWGNLSGKETSDIRHYESFCINDVKFQLYDCVCLHNENTKELPYIAKIKDFWEVKETGEKQVQVRWFFRPHEIQVSKDNWSHLEDNEVFLAIGNAAGVENVNNWAAITGKARILCKADHPGNLRPTIEDLAHAENIFKAVYNVEADKLEEIDEALRELPAEAVFNKQEWVSVPPLLPGRTSLSLSDTSAHVNHGANDRNPAPKGEAASGKGVEKQAGKRPMDEQEDGSKPGSKRQKVSGERLVRLEKCADEGEERQGSPGLGGNTRSGSNCGSGSEGVSGKGRTEKPAGKGSGRRQVSENVVENGPKRQSKAAAAAKVKQEGNTRRVVQPTCTTDVAAPGKSGKRTMSLNQPRDREGDVRGTSDALPSPRVTGKPPLPSRRDFSPKGGFLDSKTALQQRDSLERKGVSAKEGGRSIDVESRETGHQAGKGTGSKERERGVNGQGQGSSSVKHRDGQDSENETKLIHKNSHVNNARLTSKDQARFGDEEGGEVRVKLEDKDSPRVGDKVGKKLDTSYTTGARPSGASPREELMVKIKPPKLELDRNRSLTPREGAKVKDEKALHSKAKVTNVDWGVKPKVVPGKKSMHGGGRAGPSGRATADESLKQGSADSDKMGKDRVREGQPGPGKPRKGEAAGLPSSSKQQMLKPKSSCKEVSTSVLRKGNGKRALERSAMGPPADSSQNVKAKNQEPMHGTASNKPDKSFADNTAADQDHVGQLQAAKREPLATDPEPLPTKLAKAADSPRQVKTEQKDGYVLPSKSGPTERRPGEEKLVEQGAVGPAEKRGAGQAEKTKPGREARAESKGAAAPGSRAGPSVQDKWGSGAPKPAAAAKGRDRLYSGLLSAEGYEAGRRVLFKHKWEEQLPRALQQERVLQLYNLDPSLTTAELQEVLEEVLPGLVQDARMMPQKTTEPTTAASAVVIMKFTEDAVAAYNKMMEQVLLLGDDERPVVPTLAEPPPPPDKAPFPGHMNLEKFQSNKRAMHSEDHKKAVATSHSSQSNTLEYAMGLTWRMKREEQEAIFAELLKIQAVESRNCCQGGAWLQREKKRWESD